MKQFIVPSFEKDVAGVYRVRFNTGHFYIGSSTNLRLRFSQWKTRLKKGVRKNIDMLAVYSECNSITFEVIEVVDDNSALLSREDFYIKLFWGIDKLLNRSPSAFTNLGLIQSNDRIKYKLLQPMAKVDSNANIIERYKSLSECAKANGVSEKTIRRSYKKLGLTCGGNIYRKISPDGELIIPPFIPNKPNLRRTGYKLSEEARLRIKLRDKQRKESGVTHSLRGPSSSFNILFSPTV